LISGEFRKFKYTSSEPGYCGIVRIVKDENVPDAKVVLDYFIILKLRLVCCSIFSVGFLRSLDFTTFFRPFICRN